MLNIYTNIKYFQIRKRHRQIIVRTDLFIGVT